MMSYEKYSVPGGMVKGISHRGHDFAPNTDSGPQRVFLHLHKGVNPEDIPGFVTLSDGVPRKLYSRGKGMYVQSAAQDIHI